MVKYLSVKAVAGVLLALAVACASSARAGEVVHGVKFSSGTSFENLTCGPFNPTMSDGGSVQGPYFWYADETNDIGRVVEYASGAAYDYEAHGLTRSAFLAGEEPDQTRYCQVNGAGCPLHRSIFARAAFGDSFSNVFVRTGTRESIYCDMLTQFTAGGNYPTLDDSARIVVWARSQETETGELVTNLMVTAGCLSNRFQNVTVRHYCLDFELDAAKWYRLTIRAHGDVSARGDGLAAFSIYLDGQPVRALASEYEIVDPQDSPTGWLEPEARALQADRRLFPSLVKPGSDKAYTISGLSFSGVGRVDDVTFSSDDPGYAQPEAVFTFNWDAGFAAPLAFTVDGGATTNSVSVETARSCDVLIGAAPTNGLTLKVTDFSYKTSLGFHPGVWLGSNGATLTNGVEFVYDGTTRNPVATVASSRETIDVGPGSPFDTFKSALLALDLSTNAVKTLQLCGDMTVSRDADTYGNRDDGYVRFSNAEGEYVLDLAGHELKGAGRMPTLAVYCKSLRVIDSSAEKTGRVQPSGTYLSASERLNTSVHVYPQAKDGKYVRPVVTLQDGIYDGWVRNGGSEDDGTAAVKGTVCVEGGSYVSTNVATFYLEDCVTNRCMQFVCRDGYWSCLATNVIVWTGLGDGRRWMDPENWKSHDVPQANETALFPSREEGLPPWTVDVEDNQMTTKSLWLEGDVCLSGTNDFLGVTMKDGAPGRFCGDATLVYEGNQPGSLTATTLRGDWAGTVLLRNIGYETSATHIPKVLKNLETWGTESSTVVFNGVRGYVMDVNSHTMPYAFVLRDLVLGGKTYAAWQNDSGYTGSTLTFLGALSGDGTFQTGANSVRPILQLFKFADVRDYRGKFAISGKRVLIGSETVMASVPGLIAFGDQAVVNSGLGWTCRNVLFGETLNVLGETNDVLVTSTQKLEPDVTNTVVLLNWEPDIAWLAATNAGTASVPRWDVVVTGERPAWARVPDPAALASVAASAVYSSAGPSSASDTGYSSSALRAAALAQAQAAADTTSVSFAFEGDAVYLVIGNATRGLWYAVRYRESLDSDWIPPTAADWQQAEGPTVTIPCPQTGGSGFFGILVSYEDPTGGGN